MSKPTNMVVDDARHLTAALQGLAGPLAVATAPLGEAPPRLLAGNEAFARALGRHPTQLPGRRLADFYGKPGAESGRATQMSMQLRALYDRSGRQRHAQSGQPEPVVVGRRRCGPRRRQRLP